MTSRHSQKIAFTEEDKHIITCLQKNKKATSELFVKEINFQIEGGLAVD